MIGAGDSAGANLLLTTTLKCVQMGVPTLKGLFLAYVPTAIHFMPSPARFLCLMDPLLPFGFLMRCLKGNIDTLNILSCFERKGVREEIISIQNSISVGRFSQLESEKVVCLLNW